MDDERPQAALGNKSRSREDIQRLDLLRWRFSEAEIQRLCRLQLRRNARPDGLDLPLDPCRLRFARWLVEHGRLSEEPDGDREAPPGARETSRAPGYQGRLTSLTGGTWGGRLSGEVWRLALLHTLFRVRQAIARALEIAGEPGSLGDRLGERGPRRRSRSARPFDE